MSQLDKTICQTTDKGLVLFFNKVCSDETRESSGSNIFWVRAVVFEQSESDANNAKPTNERVGVKDLLNSVIFEGKCPPVDGTSVIEEVQEVIDLPNTYATYGELRLAYNAFWEIHRARVKFAVDNFGLTHLAPIDDNPEFTLPE